MNSQARGRVTASLIIAVLSITDPGTAQDNAPLLRYAPGGVASLPPSDVKLVLERMPADDREAVFKRAERDLGRLQLEAFHGALSPTAEARATVQILTVHTARQLADQEPTLLARIEARAGLSGKVLQTAPATPPGSPLLEFPTTPPDLMDRANTILDNSQYIYRPKRPKDEGLFPLTDRLPDLVLRVGFRSVVGLGKRMQYNGIGIYCSGVVISPTAVLTAAHCLKGPDAPPHPNQILVLTGFTGGTQTVIRLSDDRSFSGVKIHAVTDGKLHGALDSTSDEIWKNDVAVLVLAAPITNFTFAGRAKAAPKPLVLTVAGWGTTDAMPVNGVALEVTTVRLKTGASASTAAPSLLSWKASAANGAGVCRGDSGGPVFAGDQDGSQASALQLVGLVASGNNDCRSGKQYVTDLTVEATRVFVCSQAADSSYCS